MEAGEGEGGILLRLIRLPVAFVVTVSDPCSLFLRPGSLLGPSEFFHEPITVAELEGHSHVNDHRDRWKEEEPEVVTEGVAPKIRMESDCPGMLTARIKVFTNFVSPEGILLQQKQYGHHQVIIRAYGGKGGCMSLPHRLQPCKGKASVEWALGLGALWLTLFISIDNQAISFPTSFFLPTSS